MAPTYFFLIDVCKYSIDSGMLKIIAFVIKESILKDTLPGGERK